jgi:hypothetical protein
MLVKIISSCHQFLERISERTCFPRVSPRTPAPYLALCISKQRCHNFAKIKIRAGSLNTTEDFNCVGGNSKFICKN